MTKATDFKNIEVRHGIDKPRVQQFTIKRMYDSDPDLSHLEQYENYPYHDLTPREIAKYAKQDKDRLAAFKRGDWYMLGIRAECEYLLPVDSMPASAIIQKLTSGGLWSVESDSGAEYLAEVEREQIDELKGYCDMLGIQYDDKTHIERINE